MISIAVDFRVVLIAFLGFVLAVWSRRNRTKTQVGPFVPYGPRISPMAQSFSWDLEAPKKHRPFKAKYNLTMGISKPDHSDWLRIENTYAATIEYHKKLFIGPNRDELCLCQDVAKDAVAETYDYVVSFMVARFPQYFREEERSRSIKNSILGTELPCSAEQAIAEGASPRDLLLIIGEHTEEDFLLMGFDEKEQEYRLRACTGIASNGFSWNAKLGMPLTQLHGPVPQYKERLQFSMNKYFRKMQPGDIVQRFTYAVQISAQPVLYRPRGNDAIGAAAECDERAFLRLERQRLFRLPRSKFILFTIRTYLYPLRDVKIEGLGTSMATAIEAWPEDVAAYKGRDKWGEPVLTYLQAAV